MHTALDLADYIIWHCQHSGYMLTNFRLQVVLYFVQCFYLVEEKRPCFPEDFEAWPCGPIIPVVYEKHKEGLSSDFSLEKTCLTEKERDVCALTAEALFGYTEGQLYDITTRSEPYKYAYSPWENKKISKESIIRSLEGFKF